MATSISGRDALHLYLQDLLTTEEVVVAPRPAPDVVLVKPAEPSTLTPLLALMRAPEPPTEIALDEIDKRKLQALLDKQFLPSTIEATSFTEVLPMGEQAKAPAHSTAVTESPASEYIPDSSSWMENGRPRWAQSRFEILLLQVSGLSIAVPLVALGQIYPISLGLNRLPGQTAWCMGILASGGGPVRTLNTAQFVMPERYDPSFETTAKYVVTIDQLSWGLAVDAVKQPVSIEPNDVNWRQARTKRPWLAGTVRSQMCALLDVPQMAQILNQL